MKTLQSIEKEVKIRSGEEDKWYLQSIHPYRTSRDEIKGVVINYSDITSIKSTHKFLDTVIQTSPGVIYIFNIKEQRNEYSSPMTSSIAGYSAEELQNFGNAVIPTLIHPDDTGKVMSHFQKISKTESDTITTCEYRLIKKGHTAEDTNPSFMMSHDIPIERDENNKVTKICGIALEITDLKSTQIELENQHKLLSNITSISPLHVFIMEAKSKTISFTSESLLKSLGFPDVHVKDNIKATEVLPTLMSAENSKIMTDFWEDIIELNIQDSYEIITQAYDISGNVRWFNWRSMPYEWTKSGNIKSLIHFVQEITELKQNQLKLETINKELEEFSYVSSHDLQQPLNTIQSSLNILKNELQDQDSEIVHRCLDMMLQTTQSMKLNIKSILDYSKVKSDVSFHAVKLQEVLATVLTTLSTAINEVSAIIEYDKELPSIKGDSHLIGLVFQNLITNALKFQEDGSVPKIQIRYEQSPTHEIIKFIDNGIGISEKQQSRIFTLFQRLHENDKYEGTGIGLAHANKIMRLHSGRIEVDSKPGDGSSFKCYFLRGL